MAHQTVFPKVAREFVSRLILAEDTARMGESRQRRKPERYRFLAEDKPWRYGY